MLIFKMFYDVMFFGFPDYVYNVSIVSGLLFAWERCSFELTVLV